MKTYVGTRNEDGTLSVQSTASLESAHGTGITVRLDSSAVTSAETGSARAGALSEHLKNDEQAVRLHQRFQVRIRGQPFTIGWTLTRNRSNGQYNYCSTQTVRAGAQ